MLRYLLLLLLLAGRLAQAETPAQANKRLFDRTVDELNFRTFETVYDKSFTRGKFPLTLRTAAARRQFDGFGDNAGLRRLFLNYNGVAERYKNRFGNGPLTLTEFSQQLNSILLDKNFEFFIHNLPRDERVALVRAEQRLIKQATAQFNASGAPDEASPLPTADAQPEPALTAPLTTHDDDAPASLAASDEGPTIPAPDGPTPRHDWVDYLTLLLSLSCALMLGYLLTSVLPALNQRISRLGAEPESEPEPALRSLFGRLRPSRPPGLQEDRYEDDDEAAEGEDDPADDDSPDHYHGQSPR